MTPQNDNQNWEAANSFPADTPLSAATEPQAAEPHGDATSWPAEASAAAKSDPTLVSLEASLRIAGTFVLVAVLVHLLRGEPPVPLRPMQVVSDHHFVEQQPLVADEPVPDLKLKPAPRAKEPIRALPAKFMGPSRGH